MADDCNCEEHSEKIKVLEGHVTTLLSFKKYAEPILETVESMKETIQKTSVNVRWMRNISASVLVLIAIVFFYWILPVLAILQLEQKHMMEAMAKNQLTLTKTIDDNNYHTLESIKDSKIENQKIMNDLKLENQKIMNDVEKKLDKAIIKSSKINHKATVRKIKAAIKG